MFAIADKLSRHCAASACVLLAASSVAFAQPATTQEPLPAPAQSEAAPAQAPVPAQPAPASAETPAMPTPAPPPAQAETPAALPPIPAQTEAATQPQDRLSTKAKDQQRVHQQTPIGQAELDQIMAPIALYPDNLLAQIMTASTYPLEVVMAARWTKQNPGMKGDALDQAMQKQPWDPSVKGLTAVPQVLTMMSEKLDWMEQLGEAFLAQPDDVTKTVQRLRAKAEATGSLKSTEQIKVTKVKAPVPPPPPPGAPAPAVVAEEPEYIEIEPAAPDVVYVPVYDPVVVYGAWPYPVYRPFFWYPPGYVYAGGIGFGAGFVVGAALWCHYDWYHRTVWIDTRRYNRFNHAHLTGSRARWTHNPNHRGIVPYKNAKLQQRYNHSAATPRSTGKAIPTTRNAPKTATRGNVHGNVHGKTGAAVVKRNTVNSGAKPKTLHTANAPKVNTPRVTHTAKPPRALPRTATAQPVNRAMVRPAAARPRGAPPRGGAGNGGHHGRY